jgi:predicted Zn-dependent peptidase
MKYISKELNNGMAAIFIPVNDAPYVSMGFFVNIGSVDEAPDERGISHYLEHMLYKGTTNRNYKEVLRDLNYISEHFNAYTTRNFTSYFISGKNTHINKMIDVMFDIFLNSNFPKNEVEKEKNVVLEELGISKDKIGTKFQRAVCKKFGVGTSYQYDIIGTSSTIKNITRKDLTQFKNKYYNEKNSIFIICGNIKWEPIYKRINRIKPDIKIMKKKGENNVNFDDINMMSKIRRQKNCAQIIENVALQTEPYVQIDVDDTKNMGYVRIIFPSDDDTIINHLYIISNTLTNTKYPKLEVLREKHGISYDVKSYLMIFAKIHLFTIKTSFSKDNVAHGIKIIINEIKKLKKHGISNEELSYEKKVLKSALRKKVTDTDSHDIMMSTAKKILDSKNMNLNCKNLSCIKQTDAIETSNISCIKNITKSSIDKVINNLFRKDKINIFIYGNTSKKLKLNCIDTL